MATKSEIEFPKQKGWYSLSELKYLSNSLGFDSSVFTKVIFADSTTKCLGTRGLSEKKFIEMLNLKMFDKYLDNTFNNKPAKYNVRTIKKALQLIHHRVLGFPGLGQARIAYFVYENDDQLGMDADSGTILKALRLCDRVMSPVQLEKYLVNISLSIQIPCRLQLFEFLELMSLTMRIDSILMTKLADNSTEKEDYLQVIRTKEQKVMDILDKQFTASQSVSKVVQDKPKMSTAMRQPSLIQSAEYDSVVSVAQGQATELLSLVEISTANLRLARSGHSFMSSKAEDTRASTSLSFTQAANQTSQRQGLKFQFRKLPLREAWHHRNTSNSGSCDDEDCSIGDDCKLPMYKCTAQHTKANTEDVASSKLHCKPWPRVGSTGTSITSHSAKSRKIYSNVDTTTNHREPCQTPLITEDEFNKHQHRIDDLQWDMLRRETACANRLKHFTSSSSITLNSSSPEFDNGKQHHKLATLPIADVHTLSSSVLKLFEEHHQKPTNCSLSRSKSVNFKLK